MYTFQKNLTRNFSYGILGKMKISLWKEIENNLKEEIKERKLKNGDRFYSIKEVCNKFKISSITAKRVFYELEREGWIKKIKGKGSFIVKNSEPVKINLIFPDESPSRETKIAPYPVIEIFKGLQKGAEETDVEIESFSDLSFWNNIYGEIFIIVSDFKEEDLEKWKENNLTILLHTPDVKEDFSGVYVDFKRGSYKAVKYLISLGHRRIGFITGLITNPWLTSRFKGYQNALRNSDIKLDWTLIKETTSLKKEEIEEKIEELLSLKNPPTAIFATNDKRALQILEYCQKKNIKVPDEISVIGYDNIPETEMSNPPLTTVDTHLFKAGKEAIYLVLKILHTKEKKKVEKVIIQPDVVIRKSCKNIKGGEG
ncbi:GntR family transcriptional regulator [bacterium]|nr:GntR family transcriptional regulator [bacterium]